MFNVPLPLNFVFPTLVNHMLITCTSHHLFYCRVLLLMSCITQPPAEDCLHYVNLLLLSVSFTIFSWETPCVYKALVAVATFFKLHVLGK